MEIGGGIADEDVRAPGKMPAGRRRYKYKEYPMGINVGYDEIVAMLGGGLPPDS